MVLPASHLSLLFSVAAAQPQTGSQAPEHPSTPQAHSVATETNKTEAEHRVPVEALSSNKELQASSTNSQTISQPSQPATPAQSSPAKPQAPATQTNAGEKPADTPCAGPVSECTPKPTLKLGAQLFLFPIADTGIGGRKDVSHTRILQRARLSASAKWRSLGVKTELQDVRVWGQGSNAAATSDYVNTALYQGYFDLTGENKARKYHSFFRVGRQAIAWGEQRLLGYAEATVHGRAHDAVRALININDFEADLFWSIRRPSQAPGGASTPKSEHLGGLRFAYLGLPALSGELFGLLHHDDAGTPQNTQTIGNLGARVFGDPMEQLHYSLEGNLQFGKKNDLDHQAWAFAGSASWRQPMSETFAFRFKLGITGASGDKADGKSREFFNFYPSNHGKYGFVDRIGWRNMMDYELHAGFDLGKKFDLGAAYHFIGLQSDKGAWKGAGGNLIAPGTLVGSADRDLASEVDLLARYRPLESLFFQFVYGAWLPTEAGYQRMGSPAGTRRIQQRVYLMAVAKL